MANLTVTIAVTTGTQYVTGSTGSIYTFDGSQPASFTFPWVASGTVRLDQSGSSNDGHPLIFSTSNSAVLATMKAGIISSGVTYYLDGSSNQSDYTNTTTFNAATTRYIEIAPASQTDFYFACWVHGIGMGGIVDVTQDTWGALNWDDGAWSSQNDTTVTPTGIGLTSSAGEAIAYNHSGWGRLTWGELDWGEQVGTATVDVTGIGLTSSLGEVSAYNHSGWGRLTWGEYSWGTDVENETITLTGLGLTASLGDETATGTIEEGWGRGSWGNRAWGDNYSALPTGVSATTSLGDVTVVSEAQVFPTGIGTTASVGSPTGTYAVTPLGIALTSSLGDVVVNENEVIVLTGLGLTSAAGDLTTVGPGSVNVTGIGMTASLGDERAFTDVTIIPTGVAGTSGIGTATVQLLTNVAVTGIGLTGSLGSVSLVGQANVTPTGIGLTATADAGGGAFAWAPVDKGTSVTWTAVDKTAA